MLHTETVTGEAFELLKKLMKDSKLTDFNLAGGTALALLMGHRKSIDLDLFTSKPFDTKKIENHLTDEYNFMVDYSETNTLKGDINGLKVDFITHNYPFIESLSLKDEIRFYGVKDIAAMKLSAIADNGTRLKDFVDIACLSTKMSLKEMLESYRYKYANTSTYRALKGLSYYEDVKFKEPIEMVNGHYEWSRIEKRLQNMIRNENRIFTDLPIN